MLFKLVDIIRTNKLIKANKFHSKQLYLAVDSINLYICYYFQTSGHNATDSSLWYKLL